MSEQQHEYESYHRRLDDDIDQVYPHYRHELSIKSLEKRTDDMEKFIMDSALSIAYVNLCCVAR